MVPSGSLGAARLQIQLPRAAPPKAAIATNLMLRGGKALFESRYKMAAAADPQTKAPKMLPKLSAYLNIYARICRTTLPCTSVSR